jgi:hypothetical protein
MCQKTFFLQPRRQLPSLWKRAATHEKGPKRLFTIIWALCNLYFFMSFFFPPAFHAPYPSLHQDFFFVSTEYIDRGITGRLGTARSTL